MNFSYSNYKYCNYKTKSYYYLPVVLNVTNQIVAVTMSSQRSGLNTTKYLVAL